ncbi:MAG: hypothetical protein JSU95_10825 [Betaproteobacteria bacterium]|nr:MAG: hypothetical protein JSU95_10825 [Betaproteobacteria bacterium]
MHYHQVLDTLGPPTRISALPDGFAFEYESFRIDERQLGLSPNVKFLRWFKLAYGTARVARETYTLVFDSNGLVKAFGNAREDQDAGKGLAFQFIVTVTQVVDTRYLDEWPGQHAWGVSMLQPLPVALNREQSLDSGEHGIEQRGTPTSSGQRTLEWR